MPRNPSLDLTSNNDFDSMGSLFFGHNASDVRSSSLLRIGELSSRSFRVLGGPANGNVPSKRSIINNNQPSVIILGAIYCILLDKDRLLPIGEPSLSTCDGENIIDVDRRMSISAATEPFWAVPVAAT